MPNPNKQKSNKCPFQIGTFGCSCPKCFEKMKNSHIWDKEEVKETINYLQQVGDVHCLRCHKEFKDSIHTLNCPLEVKHCGRLENKECEFSKPHPNHICRFNDGKQNCDCYADGYADGLKIGQEVKEVSLKGKTVEVKIDGKEYKAIIQ